MFDVDKFGRRNILALNIAVFSFAMPLVALSPAWGSFVAAYCIVRFARSMAPWMFKRLSSSLGDFTLRRRGRAGCSGCQSAPVRREPQS
jgi:MFS family permease